MTEQIRLLRMWSRKDGATTTYIIEVSNGAECWAVTRRYSEFRRCHVQLLEYFRAAEIPFFPPKEPIFKKLLGNIEEHSAFLRHRECELQNYLVGLLQRPGLCRSAPVQTLLDVPLGVRQGGGSAASSGMHYAEEEQNAASFSGFRVRLTGELGGLEVVIRAGSHADASLRPTVVHLTLQELPDDDGRLGSADQRLDEILEFLDSTEVKKQFSLPPGTFWEVSAYGTTANGLVGSAVSLRVRAPGKIELSDLPASAIESFSSSDREREKVHEIINEASYTLKCIGCSKKMVWCAGHCGEGGYVGGQFVCNNGSQCKNAGGPLQEGFRWNCPSCLFDFCGACKSHQDLAKATVIDNPQSAEVITETVDVVKSLEKKEIDSVTEPVSIGDNQQESVDSGSSDAEDDFPSSRTPDQWERLPRYADADEELGGDEIQDGGIGKVSFKRNLSRLPLGPEDHRVLSARGNVAKKYLKNVEEKSLQVIEKAPFRFEAVDGEKRTVPLRFSAKSVGDIEDASQERRDAEVLDQTRRRMELSKLQKEEQNAAAWISEVTGHPDVSAAARGETTLQAAIQSGEALCDLINAIWPERIIGVLRGEVNPIRRVDNIQKFCKACREVGVEEAAIVAPLDVASGKDINVVRCLLALNAVLPHDFEGVRLADYLEQQQVLVTPR